MLLARLVEIGLELARSVEVRDHRDRDFVTGLDIRWEVHAADEPALFIFLGPRHQRLAALGRHARQYHRYGPTVCAVTRRVRVSICRVAFRHRWRGLVTDSLELQPLKGARPVKMILGGSRSDVHIIDRTVQQLHERRRSLLVDRTAEGWLESRIESVRIEVGHLPAGIVDRLKRFDESLVGAIPE